MEQNTKNELNQLRQRIDAIDRTLIATLGERFQVTKEVGLYKKTHGIEASDPDRERQMFEKIKLLAQQEGLNPEMATNIFRIIVDEVVKNHKSL